MSALLVLPITTAISTTAGRVYQFRNGPPRALAVEAKLAYGSGGTSINAYVQTSIDGGTSWCDIANFRFSTAAGTSLFNLSALTPVTTVVTATDGSIASNTSLDGIIGSHVRVKYATTGTYSATTLTVAVNVGVTPAS
jgi:hypothetical protein